jgi:hypothetical protein
LLNLRCEGDPATVRHHVERLDAEPVACSEESFVAIVPNEEGEHAEKALETGASPNLVSGEQDLAVAVGAEDVAKRL